MNLRVNAAPLPGGPMGWLVVYYFFMGALDVDASNG